MRVIGGLIGVIIGFLLLRYTFELVQWFGHVQLAEKYLGNGGTYNMYRIGGVVIIFLSLMYMFGRIGSVVAPLDVVF